MSEVKSNRAWRLEAETLREENQRLASAWEAMQQAKAAEAAEVRKWFYEAQSLRAELAEEKRVALYHEAQAAKIYAELAAAQARVEELARDVLQWQINSRENKLIAEQLAASSDRKLAKSQAENQKLREAITWTLEFLQRDQWMDYRARSVESDTLSGSIQVVLTKALGQ